MPHAPLRALLHRLKRHYPDTRPFLRSRDPFGYLCAVILSAQCTDARVNQVAPHLWDAYPTPEALAHAPVKDVERIIRSTGFYHNKARNLIGCAKALVERYGGRIPREMDALLQVPGVGRKTANVVLGEVYGIAEGITVDTHVGRLSYRLGLTKHKDPKRIEQDLMRIVPKEEWLTLPHRLIQHGRKICTARKPACGTCPLASGCPRQGMPPLREGGPGVVKVP